jgi:nitroreductase
MNSMTKLANTRYPVIDLIKQRWSARAFSEKELSEEQLLTLIEAASWAPSSMNEQPWRYRYALRGTEAFNQMLDCLLPGNQSWAGNAAALIFCSAKRLFSQNGKPNHYALHDTGMANGFLTLQATQMDIYGHIMAGYDKEKTRATLALGDEDEDVCFFALGYLGDPEQLDEPFKTREITPRSRKAVEELVL